MRGYRKRSLWKVILLLSITALEGLAFGAKAREASSGALVQAGAFSPKCAANPHPLVLMRLYAIVILETIYRIAPGTLIGSYAYREVPYRKVLSAPLEPRNLLVDPFKVCA